MAAQTDALSWRAIFLAFLPTCQGDILLKQYDVLILGSGTAGQSIALRLADHLRVALVTKRELADSASNWAQGGIAAVLDTTDSIEAHLQDTFIAGAGLCNPVLTRVVVENGKRAIEWLIDRGVPFTREADTKLGYHLTRERRTLAPAHHPCGRRDRRCSADHARRACPQSSEHRYLRAPHRGRSGDRRQGRPTGRGLSRRLRARHQGRRGRHLRCAQHRARHRRYRQGLSVHDQPRRGDRRRRGHGVACGLPDRKHGVHPVSSDLPLPPAGEILPDLGGGAWRRRPAEAARWHPLHARTRSARRTGAARHRRPRDRLRNEEARHRLRSTWTSATNRRIGCAATSPTSMRAASNWASISPRSRFRWCPLPTTRAAAS